MIDLLPLDPGAWLAGRVAGAPTAGSAFGVLVAALPGDDGWALQLAGAAEALAGKADARVLLWAPGLDLVAVAPALEAARALGGRVELVADPFPADCHAYLDAGPARLAAEARLAGVEVLEAPVELAAARARRPGHVAALDGRAMQALYLVDQARRQRGLARVLVVGDEALAAHVATLPGVTTAPTPQVDVLIRAGAAEADPAQVAAGGLLLWEGQADAAPGFTELEGAGWRLAHKEPATPILLSRPLQCLAVGAPAGDHGLCRALRQLGYELALIPPGVDLLAALEALPPEGKPEAFLFLAGPGELPPRGLDHLEIPAVAWCSSPAQRQAEPALLPFDWVAMASPEGVAALAARGHEGAFALPDVDAARQAIALLAQVQTRPSRGLSLLAGHQHFAAGEIEQAVARFGEAARGARPSIEALVNLAVCSHVLGNTPNAIGLLEAALLQDPGHVVARENLAALRADAAAAAPAPTAAPARGPGLMEREVPPYYRLVRPEIEALVPPDARRVLDVGCAAGALGAYLKQRRPGIEVVGIEPDQLASFHAARFLDAVLQGSVETLQLPFEPGYFDCIVLADVLEHLVDPEAALARLLPFLRVGGHLVISLPNVRHHEVVFDLLREGRFEYQDAGILDRTHLRFYTYTEIERWMARAGLDLTCLGANRGVADHNKFRAMQSVVEALGGSAAGFRQEGAAIQYLLQLRKPAPGTPVPLGARRPEVRRPLAPKEAPPVASLVILVRNQLDYTKLCLESVFAHASMPLEVILVDNGSTDGTGAYLRQLARQDARVHVISNAENLGFAHGCNQGIVRARGEVIVLLNNDTVVTAGWLEGLLDPLKQGKIGATGPRTNQISGTQCLNFVPYADDLGYMAEFASWLGHHMRGQGSQVIRLTGFCVAIRREVLEEIGGLDPRYGMGNFEDDDLGLRIQAAGYQLWQAADVFVHHFGGTTFKAERVDYQDLMEVNWRRFCHKWGLGELSLTRDGYPNSIARLPFDPTRDVFPLLLPEAPPAPVDAPNGFRVLATPDWDDLEAARPAIEAFRQACAGRPDAALLLWVDPAGGTGLAAARARLQAAFPGVASLVPFEAPGGPLYLGSVFTAAQAFLPTGSAAMAEAARACGLVVVDGADGLRALAERSTAGVT